MTAHLLLTTSKDAPVPPPGISLYGWGNNVNGGVGNNLSSTVTEPTNVPGSWASLTSGGLQSASSAYCLGLKSDSSLWAWGFNASGQTGLGSLSIYSSPVQVGLLTDWAYFACGTAHSLAVKSNGSLWSWGLGTRGQLGSGVATSRSSPVQVGTLTTWSRVGAAGNTSYGIKTTGELFVWGAARNGALGNGTTTPNLSSPVQLGALTDWAKISMNSQCNSVLAIKSDSSLWAWGANASGQLGNGSTTQVLSPVQIGALTTWDTCYLGTGGTVTTGCSAAVKSDGSLWTWGKSANGQLANGTTTPDISSPAQIGTLTDWKSLILNNSSAIALKTDGTVWSWGNGKSTTNLLGYPLTTSTPTVVSPIQVGTISTATQLGLGCDSLGAYFDGSSLYTWGATPFNGLNRIITYSSPVQIGALNYWRSLSVGNGFSLAIGRMGALYSWGGTNSVGQLGTTGWIQSDAVQIGSSTQWRSVSAANSTAAAIRSNGSLWTWGSAANGALGNSTTTPNLGSPAQVGALTNWKSISCGTDFTLAIKSDSSLWAFGTNTVGQCGLGTTTNVSSPTQVGTLTDWARVSAGSNHCSAIKSDGSIWAWGANASGQLGNGTITPDISSPIQIGALTDWKMVSAGSSCTLAVKTDGTLWAWGLGATGRLGTGSTTSRSSPVQVGALTDWDKIVTSRNAASLGIKTDGTLWSWGFSPVGSGTGAITSSPVRVGALATWLDVTAGATTNGGAFVT